MIAISPCRFSESSIFLSRSGVAPTYGPTRLMIACPPEAESAYRMLPPITVASSSRTSTPISPTFPCAACTPIRTISRSPG